MRQRPYVLLLDGAMGTALQAAGAPVGGASWSGRAVVEAPDAVRALHRRYAEAGAQVHTAVTFRGDHAVIGRAVEIARSAVPVDHRVAGSLAPAADCYRPDETPSEVRAVHRDRARALARAGVDLVLCETFASSEEAIIAVEEARETDLPVWLALTAGPNAELATPLQIERTGRRAVKAGASAVLVNCTRATRMLEYVRAIADLDVVVGAYANAGPPEDGLGWLVDWPQPRPGPEEMARRAERYAELALGWVGAGATVIGGCCGTFPIHIEKICDALRG